MTVGNNTQDNKLHRFSGFIWLVGSVAIHAVLLAVLFFSGLLDSQVVVQVHNEGATRQQKTTRKERRQARVIPQEHAELLRKEAEFVKRRNAVEQLERIAENLKRLEAAKKLRVEQIENRSASQIESELIAQIRTAARTFAMESSRGYGGAERIELREFAAQTRVDAEKLFDTPQATEQRDLLIESTDTAFEKARTNAAQTVVVSLGSKSLGLPEDKHIFGLADGLKRLVDRLIEMKQADADSLNQIAGLTEKKNPSDSASMTTAELYERAVELEKQIASQFTDVMTLDKALDETISLEQARQRVEATEPPDRPDLGPQLAAQAQTIGDVNSFRTAVSEMSDQISDIENHTRSLLQQVAGIQLLDPENAALAMKMRKALNLSASQSQRGLVDLSQAMRNLEGLNSGAISQGGSPGSGSLADAEFHIEGEGGRFMARVDPYNEVRLPQELILAQALPARRFSREAARKGWLYLDTWYKIGPWENGGSVTYTNEHPPENVIDFDAVYSDGKGGEKLRWEFIQSNNIRIIPENSQRDATYYYYTEMEFDEGMDLFVAIASDDAAKVWLNDQVIWQENGLSQWRIGEGLRKVYFRQGTNKILVRLENGPGECIFSMLLCPEDAVKASR